MNDSFESHLQALVAGASHFWQGRRAAASPSAFGGRNGLTFPIVLQQQWEISRRYAMFATPIAYLIDEDGVIVKDVAVGSDAILDLMTSLVRPAMASVGLAGS